MAKNKSAVVAVKDDKLPSANLDLMSQLAAASGEGLEAVTARDVLIPRLAILQALSPQLQKTKPEYVKGAQAGDMCDTSTGNVFNSGLKVLPVYYEVKWLEWSPRNTGKGLVAIHDTEDCLVGSTRNERGQVISAGGNTLVESAQFFVLNLSDGNRRAFIAMSSTQRKKAKRWLTLATGERIKLPNGKEVIPPLYYRAYDLSVVEESNAEGSWLGWKVERGASLNEMQNGSNLLAEAKEFRQSILAGKVKVDNQSIADEAKSEEVF